MNKKTYKIALFFLIATAGLCSPNNLKAEERDRIHNPRGSNQGWPTFSGSPGAYAGIAIMIIAAISTIRYLWEPNEYEQACIEQQKKQPILDHTKTPK